MSDNIKDLPRRTIKELSFDMRRGGQDKLVIVEGSSDKRFYGSRLKQRLASDGVRRVALTPVSFIQVPAEWLTEKENYRNNRSLVAAVTRGLHGVMRFPFRGIIDLDCGMPAEWASIKGLLVSDFPAIESFAFTARVLERFVDFFVKEEAPSSAELVEELASPLHFLYQIRIKYGRLPVSIGKLVEFNGTWLLHTEKVPGLNIASVEGPGDPRAYCYGHDLVQVLRLRFPSVKKQNIRDEELESVLVSHVGEEEIPASSMLENLAVWVEVAS